MDSLKELSRPRFYVILCQSNFGSFQDASQIVFEILEDHEDIFRERSIRSLLIGANDFFEKDHIGMLESLKELYLTKCRNRESVFLLFCVNALESDNFVCGFVSSHKHTSVGSLANLELLLKGIDISHNNGCPNRNRFTTRRTRLLLEGISLTVVAGCRWRRDHGTASLVAIAICVRGIDVHSWGWRRGRRSTTASASK